jgi:hypothetical protein
MGRFFLLVVLCTPCLVQVCTAQNLVLNPSFETTIFKTNMKNTAKKDTFYALNWFTPTDGSVDIYRDIKVCDDKHIFNKEPLGRFCLPVHSGNYCAGLILMESENGAVEHITATLAQPLVAGQAYKVSYYLRFGATHASAGFAYKFSTDSIVFKSKDYHIHGLTPMYNSLFETNPITADFELLYPFTDTTWRKVESLYIAKGGEKFITFGKFCSGNHIALLKEFNYGIKHVAAVNKKRNLKQFNLSIFNEFAPEAESICKESGDINYYFIDDVSVAAITPDEQKLSFLHCNGCIDSDPLTTHIPDKAIMKIDRGFEGDLSIEIHASLRYMEKLVITLDSNKKLIIANLNNKSPDEFQTLVYSFKYKAHKLYEQPVTYSIQQTSNYDLKDLDKSFKKTTYSMSGFEGILYSNLK